MASGLVERVTLSISVELFKTELKELGDAVLYIASVPFIAAGSGETPEEAYESLAYCLAVGDPDVAARIRIEPWKTIIQQAVMRVHGTLPKRTTKLPSSGDAEG